MLSKLKILRTVAEVITTDKTQNGAKRIVQEPWTHAGINRDEFLHRIKTHSPVEKEQFLQSQKALINELVKTLNEFRAHEPAFTDLLVEEIRRETTELFERPIL